jgi:hypothetical protein
MVYLMTFEHYIAASFNECSAELHVEGGAMAYLIMLLRLALGRTKSY